MRWRLANAAGQSVASEEIIFSGNVGYASEISGAPVAVSPGRYRLTVESTGRQAGELQFRLLHRASTSALSVAGGQSIALDLPTGHEDNVYKFHADAKVNLSLAASLALPSSRLQWQVTDATGRRVGSGQMSPGTAGQVALPQGGDYYLWLGGRIDNTEGVTGEVSFTLWNDLTVEGGSVSQTQGAEWAGAVQAAGQTVTQSFP